MKSFLCGIGLLALLFVESVGGRCAAAEDKPADIVIYGGTSAGITAAIQAAKMKRSVILIEPTRHLGGLTSGGLGSTDIGNKKAIGGLAHEFYQRIYRYYSEKKDVWTNETFETYKKRVKGHWVDADTMWGFEPHVAELIYRQMLQEAGVPVVLGERLDLKNGVRKDGAAITAIVMESGRVFSGRMFIDATYEGDLMARAGVKYAVGREANAQYGETLDGVQTQHATSHQFLYPIDPYVKAGDPKSGLLPGIHEGGPGEEGSGDHRVQAYNFRMCLTDAKENCVPFPKPANYDPLRYELLIRYVQAGWKDVLGNNAPMPNHKTDTNNHGAFSTDDIGMNYAYPDGDYATRDKIIAEHRDYQLGLMWTLANDPRVPAKLQKSLQRWGLAKDEFADNGNWPHQLYVREARRMIADYVMTEKNCRGKTAVKDSVGLAAYNMDSHNTQRYVDAKGHAKNEGDVEVWGGPPYPISFRAIVPKAAECTNLVVPVCLSATHIAYGSIRMEPVFMVLGQSAATVASLAIDQNGSVQSVAYEPLALQLKKDGQILEWTFKAEPKSKGKAKAKPRR